MVKRSLSQDYKESSNGCDVGYCCGFSSASRNNSQNAASSRLVENPDVDVAAEWNQLSPEERNQVYEDIHGVFKPIAETPELLHRSLAEMQVELDKQSRAERPTGTSRVKSYDKALTKGRSYVENPKFRLAFLRSERFDAAKSAERFMNYFDLTEFLFGEELLCRDITQDDLGPKELEHLHHGHIQFLTQRYSAGRAIQFLDPLALMEMASADAEKEKILTHACMYLVMRAVLDSVETQKKGFVSVIYGVDTRVKTTQDFKFPKARFIHTLTRAFTSVPMWFNSMHFLSDDIRLQPFMFLFQFAAGRVVRARSQSHYGAPIECKYALMTYGLPVGSIPTNEAGVITYTKHAKSLKRYCARELALQEEAFTGKPSKIDWDEAVFMPNNDDVLLGRGRPYQDHHGNIKLRDLIARRGDEYNYIVGRGGKAVIALEIIKEIQSQGGRFLTLDAATEWWLPISDKEAKDKVCQRFRKKREKDLAAGSRTIRKEATNQAKQSDGRCNKVQVVENSSLLTRCDDDELKALGDGQIEDDPLILETDLPLGPKVGNGILNAEEIPYMLDGSSPVPGGDSKCAADTAINDPLAHEEEKIDRSVFDDNPASPIGNGGPAMDEPGMKVQEGKDCYNDDKPLNSKDHCEGEFIGLDISKLLSVLTNSQHDDDGETSRGDESKTEDPLLAFLKSHRDSLKCTPHESFYWLRNQDIMTLGDLQEACLDEEFLEFEFKTNGGLKGFKRRQFVKAVVAATRIEN